MDAISMAMSTMQMQPVADLSRVMMDASAKMTDMANDMLKVGHEIALKGKEMGKGSLLDLIA